jgi:RTX calcium-binding nonapeptide repeat (4 copies)
MKRLAMIIGHVGVVVLSMLVVWVAVGAAQTAPGCANPTATGVGARDTMNGTAQVDRLLGAGGRDVLNGLQGNDCLDGGDGADQLAGASGHDRLFGGNGNDRLNGGFGSDVLVGGLGNDRLDGSDRRDEFLAGEGNDVVFAVDGIAERIECGPGRDTVYFDPDDTLVGCERLNQVVSIPE